MISSYPIRTLKNPRRDRFFKIIKIQIINIYKSKINLPSYRLRPSFPFVCSTFFLFSLESTCVCVKWLLPFSVQQAVPLQVSSFLHIFCCILPNDWYPVQLHLVCVFGFHCLKLRMQILVKNHCCCM